jgi:hypothetical protein
MREWHNPQIPFGVNITVELRNITNTPGSDDS